MIIIINRFVLSLLSFNLVATVVLLPLILMDSLIDTNLYEASPLHGATMDYAVCVAGQAVTTLVTTGSISAALVIAVDQYCAVMAPLHYHRRVTKAKAWLLLAGQWILAVAMAAFSLPDTAGKHFWKGCSGAQHRSRSSHHMESLITSPLVTDDEELLNNITMTTNGTAPIVSSSSTTPHVWTVLFVSGSVLCYVVPLVLLSWMYLRIYSAAHRNSQRTRRTSLTHSASELVVHCLAAQQGAQPSSTNSSPLSGSLAQMNNPALLCPPEATAMMSRSPSLRSTSSQIVHNLRYRISNASLFLYREEARAARVSVLVLVLVVACWMPYHVLLALHGWAEAAGWNSDDNALPSYAYHLSLVAVLINALSSPFLYAYRSRRIQREVRRLFGLPPKSRKGIGHHHRELSKRRTKTLRSLSPRRQLLRKHVRADEKYRADELLALSSSHSSSRGTETTTTTTSSEVRHLMAKVTWLWHNSNGGAGASSKLPGADEAARVVICAAASTNNTVAAAAASELTVAAAAGSLGVDISRSSFSSATSTSTSSAESDVSL